LRTHHIQLPPLRERREDLSQLTLHFVEKAVDSLGKPAPSVPPALFQWLHNYAFPCNIHELGGMAFDAVARSQGAVLPLQSFKEAIMDDLQAYMMAPRQQTVRLLQAAFLNACRL